MLVPAGIEIVSETDTTLTVEVQAPSGNPDIDLYMVVAAPSKECTLKATDSPLQCQVTDLAPLDNYAVSAFACMQRNKDCGAAVKKNATTRPPGEHSVQIIIIIIIIIIMLQ